MNGMNVLDAQRRLHKYLSSEPEENELTQAIRLILHDYGLVCSALCKLTTFDIEEAKRRPEGKEGGALPW